ncbi:MAG: hypothetical protein K6G80_08140 [Treponema sp.]|nr:hypothetical protein [Treponema sp.]
MDIRVFSYDSGTVTEITEKLAQTSFSGFDTAGGTTVKIAQYYTSAVAATLEEESDEYKLYRNYCAMYDGAASGSDATLYTVITLTDAAGNTSDRTFIKSKLNALVKEAAELSSAPETAEYKKILNGTYSGTITSEQQEIIRQILMENDYDQTGLSQTYAYVAIEGTGDWPSKGSDNSYARLAMSINSDNAPKYEITGYALDVDNWIQTASGSPINIKVTAGLDGTYVRPETLNVALYRCSDTGAKTSTVPEFTSANGDFTVTNSSGKSVSEITTSVSTATYTITLPTLKSNYYYLVEATGLDEDDNELSADTLYGFLVSSAGNAPVQEATDKQWVQAAALSATASAAYTLPVVITDPVADINTAATDAEYMSQGVTYSFTVYGKYISSKNYLSANDSAILYTSEETTLTGPEAIVLSADSANQYTASLPIAFDISAFAAENYTVAVSVKAQNSEESCSSTYIIWGDNTAPALSITNAELLDEDSAIITGGVVITENSSFYTENEDGTVTYTIKGRWSDENGSGTAHLYYSTVAGAAIGDEGVWTAFSSDDAPATTDSVKLSRDFTVTQGSGQSFSFYAEDDTGNVSGVLSIRDINFDFAVPVITLDAITTPTNSSVTISGTVTDTNAITADTVSVTITAPDGVTAPAVTKTTDGGLSVSYTATVDASAATHANDGSWTVSVTATDGAGRSAVNQSATFVLDTKAPVFQDANATYPAYVNNAAYTASYDDDSGEWTGNWYSSTSLSVSGCYAESLSGVSAVYYQVASPAAQAESGFTALSQTNYTSAVASANGVSAVSDVSSFTTTPHDGGIASYSAILSGFEASSSANTLRLVAVDAAGNPSSVKEYAIYIDQDSPTLSCTSHSGQEYTNTVTAIPVSGTATDSSSGVASVVLSLDGSTQLVNAEVGDADSEGKCSWSAQITTDMLSALTDGSMNNVNATVTDKAGNSSASTIFNLQVDRTAPSVSMTTPSAGSTINGTLKIQGSITASGAAPASLTLYCSQSAPVSTTTLSDLTQIGEPITDAASIYSWTFTDVDVQTLAGVTTTSTSKKLYLVPVVVDTAGNCNIYTEQTAGEYEYSYVKGTNYFEYTVDQNSDRPVIQITSMENDSSWLTSATLRGTVTDDDGVDSLYISQDGTNYSPVTVSNSSWSYQISGGDSAQIKLYFMVKDTGKTTTYDAAGNATVTTGSEFVTGKSSVFARPYYKYSNASESDSGIDNTEALTVKLDTAVPRLYTMGLAVAESYADYSDSAATGLATVAGVKAAPASYTISSSRYAGGNRKYFKVYVPLYDANIAGGAVAVSISDASSGTVETTAYTYIDDNTVSGATPSAITEGSFALSATTTTTENDSVTYMYYESKPIVCSDADSGLKTLTVTVTDAAGNVTTGTASFYVDNEGPVSITVTSPSSTDEITGTTTITGTASDSGIGIANIEWLIPTKTIKVDGTTYSNYTDESATGYATDAVLDSLDTWVSANNTGTASVFKFKFTSGSNYDLTAYDSEETYAVTYDSNNLRYTIPVFFRTTDSLGNTHIDRSYYITHNPDGDRPVTEINYPTETDYDTDTAGASLGYITLAGTIRVSGTVEIPSLTCDVGQVYVQIGTGTSVDSLTVVSDSSALAEEFESLGGVVTPTATGSGDSTVYSIGEDYPSTTYVDASWWGIPATTKTATWNISLNAKGYLNPSASNETTNIAIRACAINADGKMGNWTDWYFIRVDSNAPSQSAEMRQYESDITSATDSGVTTTKDYASEMYLKGKWYLVVTLSDNESLKYSTISVKKGSATTDFYAETEADQTNTSGVTNKLYIPIDTTLIASSSVSYTVYAEDSSGHSSSMTYTFYIDNMAPALGSVGGNGTELSETAETEVVDSNYVYTLSGTLQDAGSGYSKVAFYFLRNGTIFGTNNTSYGTSCILDPLVTGWTSTTDAKIAFSGLVQMSTVTEEADDKLYAVKATGVVASGSESGTYTFTDSGSVVSGNNHIHAGGLIYAGGAYGLITDVTGTEVTFTSAATPTDETVVYFPYAAVVDNTSTEDVSSTTANPFEFSGGDDGDLMPESITNVSTTWTWKATIHSTNIPDGPANLVVVAFDAAGNVCQKTYPVSVTNNAPRLAKLYLGTDLNSDSTFASSEFSGYSVYDADTEKGIATTGYKSAVSITTAGFDAGQFTAKDKLAVVPEITGGNGSLYMVYKRGATSTAAVTGTTSGTDASGALLVASGTLGATSDFTAFTDSTSFVAFSLTSDQVWQGLTADPTGATGVSFTFWDETEERTAGTDSQYCVAYVTDMLIDLADGEKPTNKIDPFYWESLTDNSVYGSESITYASQLKGHVELGAGELGENLSQIPVAVSGTGTGQLGYGDDPKVSGKIKITGTAFDNKMLQTISLSVAGYAFNGGTAGAAFGFATYDGSEWTRTAGSSSKVRGGAIDTDGWQFTINEETISQGGHTVSWTLYLDTEKHSKVAALDVAIQASATDYASKTKQGSDNSSVSATASTTSEEKTSLYQIDIVPYVAGVKTSLSSLKKTNSSLYDRTALGHYPVNASDSAYFYGFNLAGGTVYDKDGTSVALSPATSATSEKWYSASATYTASPAAVYSAAVGSLTSGKVYISVNSVQSLNNVNSNDAHGSYGSTTTSTTGDYTVYSNYYNRQPNNDSNNLLTDDVELDVWAFDSDAVVPISGKIEQPHMAIDPVTGQIGFAFVNGPLYFSMAGSTEDSTKTSYDYWMGSYDFFTSVGFAYDSLGYTYGVAAGGDINSASADKFQLMTSRWGRASRGQNGSYSSSNSLRLESIGQKGDSAGNNTGTRNFDKQRIKSPSLATAVHGDDTNLYLAYYDAMNDEIRFKAGNTGDSGTTYTLVAPIEYYDNGNNGYTYGHIYLPANQTFFTDGVQVTFCDSKGNAVSDYSNYGFGTSTTYYAKSVRASGNYTDYWFTLSETNGGTALSTEAFWNGEYTQGDNVRYPNETLYVKFTATSYFGSFADVDVRGDPYQYRNGTVSMIAGNGTGYGAGSYVALGVVPGSTSTEDVVVAVWFDETSRQMLYSYNKSPLTNRNGTTNRSGWSEPIAIFDGTDYDSAGEYCQIAVDANGGIHIAAYDGSNCDLVYAYLPTYNGKVSTCVVDSNGVIGSNITIDVALDANGKAVPRIGYYATSCVRPKLAYLVDTSSTAAAGAEDDAFTGAWECTIVPTTSSVTTQSNQYNKMNVGIWKDSDGKVTTSTTGTSSTSNTPNGYSSESYGFVYGNGTANAVMGYAIKVNSSTDAIETAQMQ